MALTTTGSNADSYVDLTFADAYADDHFIGDDKTAWDAAGNDDKEASLRQAAQYIDASFRSDFPGYIRSDSQALEWPRSNAYDISGRHISGVPNIVKTVQVELAKERIVAGDNLVPVTERGGRVKSVTVGPITTTYMDNAEPVRVYRFAKKLLSAVTDHRGNRLVRT